MRAKMKSPKEIPEELWTVMVCGDRWGHRQSVESSYSATRSTTSASTTANNKEPTLAAPYQVLISTLSGWQAGPGFYVYANYFCFSRPTVRERMTPRGMLSWRARRWSPPVSCDSNVYSTSSVPKS